MRQVVPVRSADVDTIWDQVRPYIAAALARGRSTHTEDDVRKRCRERDAQLWLGIDDGLKAVAVTEICVYPQKKIARVWIFAAEDAPSWIENDLGHIKAWARAEGCSELEMSGRLGWRRRLPGWGVREVLMTKELGNG